jgi:methyl-accepting chemotaxis protein
MRHAMEPQKPSQESHPERLSLEVAAGSLIGAAAAGALALGVHSVTDSHVLACVAMLLPAGGLAWWSHGRARGSLRLVSAIQAAAEELGAGATITRLDADQPGSEFGQVAGAFNRIFELMSTVAHRVLGIVHSMQSLPARIIDSMQEIQSSADAQEEAVEETASLLANINTSMNDINQQIEKLQRSSEDSASSILQMGSSVDEVARNAATLHESVETSTSSVHEMGASIKQVALSAEQVERIAEETAASMLEMDRVVQEVTGHAKEASELTQKVTEGADRGSEAVSETISDIQLIRDRTSEARATLGQLVDRISKIGGILNVIGEINDETNLLSLNAAIIAAQAGEQGKAFLVVANHVKTLAKRTASSTKDIERLVQDVQDESVQAVDAMSAGIEAIETGVMRSQAAGNALREILDSSREAYARVEGIARATDEQSRSSKLVSKATQETSSQIQQISTAMAEQSKVSEQMLQNAEASLDICRHVHSSTEEQRETGRYITESISTITDMIRLIKENAATHGRASESVAEAVMRLLENAQRSGQQIPEINGMLRELSEGAEVIIGELSRFEGTVANFDNVEID